MYMQGIPEIVNIAISGAVLANEVLKDERVKGCLSQLFIHLKNKITRKSKITGNDLKI